MTDKPMHYIDEDGSTYAAEIVPPERDTYGAKYYVDLVRASVDAHGLERQQRLTVGQHDSWGEAEQQLYALEDRLEQDGLVGWGAEAEQLKAQPFEDDRLYLAVMYPPDGEGMTQAHLLAIGERTLDTALVAEGERESVEQVVDRLDALQAEAGNEPLLETAQMEAGLPPATPIFDRDDDAVRHIDGGGTAHWFAVVERDEPESDPYELRYFRALEMNDGSQRSDSYPVMPLPDDDPGSAWALPALEIYLEKGDVYMAQQFAHDVADSYGESFPEPMDLPALDPRPEYYFGYGVGPSNSPSLEAVKTWMDGAERRFDTLTIAEYDSFDAAARDEAHLEAMQQAWGLQSAMNLAETLAADNGYLDPERTDPRIFFADNAPTDPFTTIREAEINDELARYGVTWGETQEWDTEIDPQTPTAPTPYWRMETLPVNNPEGEPLGHSLHMVVYDGVEHDLEMVGTPAIPDNEPFRMLEMAHFETTEAADKFGVEFNGYLMPGLLEGPELAEEVARLEGHPVEWKTLDGQELDDYRDLKLTLTRDPADWQPYNPNAERDARIEAEGLYTDPIHMHTVGRPFTTFDEDEDDPKNEPVSPDFDL